MQRDHELNITVLGGSELHVKVVYRDKVPDLLAGFSEQAQRWARRWFWMPTRDERRLWKAAQGMPRWARETVRQHILRERAERIEARLKLRAERAAARALRRQVRIEAVRQVVRPVPRRDRDDGRVRRDSPEARAVPERRADDSLTQRVEKEPLVAEARVHFGPRPQRAAPGLDRYGDDSLTSRLASGVALSSVPLPEPTLTERLSEGHSVPLAVPPKVIRYHGRDR